MSKEACTQSVSAFLRIPQWAVRVHRPHPPGCSAESHLALKQDFRVNSLSQIFCNLGQCSFQAFAKKAELWAHPSQLKFSKIMVPHLHQYYLGHLFILQILMCTHYHTLSLVTKLTSLITYCFHFLFWGHTQWFWGLLLLGLCSRIRLLEFRGPYIESLLAIYRTRVQPPVLLLQSQEYIVLRIFSNLIYAFKNIIASFRTIFKDLVGRNNFWYWSSKMLS